MRTRPRDNYLKMYRRRCRLSQSELAYLMGCKDRTCISRYETGAIIPMLRTLLAYETVFGVCISILFAGLKEEIESKIVRRAERLQRKLGEATTENQREQLKRQFIKGLSRASKEMRTEFYERP